uniref:hypothetical protein n=1 Tax=Ferrovibrio sp. TaxID=1917215 RepID=UPI00311DC503
MSVETRTAVPGAQFSGPEFPGSGPAAAAPKPRRKSPVRIDWAAAARLWQQLLQRVPDETVSARARQHQPDLHPELLERFPSHPAALATAVAMAPTPERGHQGAQHLARWGWRWPGAMDRLKSACSA